jgi:signal transduction histidine kinase
VNTLRARVLMLVAASGLVTALVLGVLMIGAVRNLYNDLIYSQTDDFAKRVVEMHPEMISEYDRDRQAFAERLQSYVLFAPHTGLYLVSSDGAILATSGQGRIHWSRYRVDLKSILAAQAYDAHMPVFAEDPDAAGEQRIVALRPLRKDDGNAGWLMVVSRSADLLTQTSEMVRSYALRTGAKAALLTLAIAVALTAAMMAVLTRPLSLLTRRVERIRRSGFSQPLTGEEFPFADRNDEIGRLSNSFRDAFERLKQESDRVTMTDNRRRDMVASVSHDLRTPLTALIGQLETVRMKRDSMPRHEQDRFIDGAFNNAQHLKRLVSALAELGRLDDPAFTIELEPIALHELCDDVALRFQTRAEALGLHLTVSYPDGLPLAHVDAALIERALSNLLDNAIRLTPKGGSAAVDIGTALLRGEPAIRIAVADSGPGVAVEDQPRVFDRFFQSSEHRGLRGSSGLGLAIVSRVVELHKGEAGVTSTPGSGAVFHLLLPIRPPETPAPAAP